LADEKRGEGESSMRRRTSRSIWIPIAIATITLLICCALGLLYRLAISRVPSMETPPASWFRVAYSPEKALLFTELVTTFNNAKYKTAEGENITLEAIEMDPEVMVQAAVAGEVQALSPDSSLWFDEINRTWQAQTGSEATLVGETVRYAVSPVVIAMWAETAQRLGYPNTPIGWTEVMELARQDPNFKWSHPSTTSASGMLATLAEFYAGAGKTRGLTQEDVEKQAVLDYVAAIEKTVRYYGEGELAVIERIIQEGPAYLDAFVVQEQLVVHANQKLGGRRLVAVYPKEGTLWEDHPLALLETPNLTSKQRQAFSAFRDFLLAPKQQRLILQYGYRPADLNIPLDSPESPLHPSNGVDPAQPQTTLQVPSPGIIEVVRNVWWYTKRHTNVYLVVDTSGSMSGDKIAEAKLALQTFLQQIKSEQENVGLVEFSSQVNNILELAPLAENRSRLENAIEALETGGNTALLDAVRAAYVRLQQRGDRERINAIVAMTDGKENNSRISLRELVRQVREGNASGVPVVIFCIAYGGDADYNTLQALADASGGQVRRGDLETIRQLYKILSTYF